MTQELHIDKETIVETRQVDHFTLRIDMERGLDGTVRLIAVDDKGNKLGAGNLVGLTIKGKVLRYPDVNYTLGFVQEKDGVIALEEGG